MNAPASPSCQLQISIDEQILELFESGRKIRSFPVSTSAKGMGFTQGSLRTPTGRFRISEKIGAGEPLGTIFKARQTNGIWNQSQITEDDLILTRILRLEGLDADNANTRERFIYIHGTNQEDLIGSPASHGCIRLRNHDMAELFDLIPENSEVIIQPITKPKGKILFLDCDSTLSAIEGIDELANLSDTESYKKIVELTNLAMNGEMPLAEVFKKRMQVIKPTRDMVDTVSRQYLERMVDGAEQCVKAARTNGWEIVILSGGFEQIIRPFADHLGIHHIEAVPLYFNDLGEYCGYGETYPTTRNLGKNEIIREWKSAMMPQSVIMVGDGISDLETKPDVDLMIGYGGVVDREAVRKGANYWITNLNDLIKFLS